MEFPLRTELVAHSCSVRHQSNCCVSTREIPATWISTCTQGTERCSCDKTAALARHRHTWISLRAQRDMFRRNSCCILTPHHTWISLRAQSDVSIEILLRSHSPCASKKTCSCDKTAALARHKHTWISLRAQRDMFRRNSCCALTPRAHLDLAPCAKRHVPSKKLLRSRAAPQDRWFLFADAKSSLYSHARAPPLRYREPVTRNPLTAPLLYRL